MRTYMSHKVTKMNTQRTTLSNRVSGQFWPVTLIALAVLLSGCAFLRGQQAKQDALRQQIQQFAFTQPIESIWPEVQKLMFERGFQTKTASTTTNYAIETEPALVGDNQVRYLIQGTPLANGGSTVHFNKVQTRPNGKTRSGRDFDMEWLLIQRFDPQAAAQIQAQADAIGQQAAASE